MFERDLIAGGAAVQGQAFGQLNRAADVTTPGPNEPYDGPRAVNTNAALPRIQQLEAQVADLRKTVHQMAEHFNGRITRLEAALGL